MIAVLSQLAGTGTSSGESGAAAETAQGLQSLLKQVQGLETRVREMAGELPPTRLDIFHGYTGVFVAAFLIALVTTPLMRRLAIANGIVDRPTEARKMHRVPVAYLGGVAVYLGVLAGILFSYTQPFHGLVDFHETAKGQTALPGGVPISVLLGMTVIMLCGLLDDIIHIDPRTKIAGMLFAAAALAREDVGVKVAAGVLQPLANALNIPLTNINGFETIYFSLGTLPVAGHVGIDVTYWIGTAAIALFVLGACNASNLIDGLDGLLAGTTAISSVGLLVIALALALADDGPLDSARIVLCLSLLGACLGFLPHNFNPANIFLGDAGSLLLGFLTIVIVLMLGDTGKTHLVLAGLVIYALPIIDTTLAIIRRRVAGRRISDADDNHLHHMLGRALGVKGAVFVLYAIAAGFAVLGVALSGGRVRVTYALAMVFAAFIGITAFKIARKAQIEEHMTKAEEERRIRRAVGQPEARPGDKAGPAAPQADANGTPASGEVRPAGGRR